MLPIAVIVALLQASLVLFVVFGAIESPTTFTGQPAIDAKNIWSLAGGVAEATLIVGFVVALLKRHVWGAFGLVADSVINLPLKAFQFGAGAMLGGVIFTAIYWAGTSALLRSQHNRPLFRELKWREIVRYALLLYVGWQGLSFIFALIGLNKEAATIPLFWILALTWMLTVLALAAKLDAQWPFETAMSVSIVAQLFCLVDLPFNIAYRGMTWEAAFAVWLLEGFFLLASAVVAWGVASNLPLPILPPGEAAKNILGLRFKEYDHTQVMRDARRLLVIIGAVDMGVAYFYLSTGVALKQLTEEEAWGLAVVGFVYVVAALMRSFWFRFACIVLWTCDIFYTSIVLNPKASPSMFIPVGAYFIYNMWSRRHQISAVPTALHQNALEKQSGIADQSISP